MSRKGALCVWPARIMGDNTPADFEQFMLDNYGIRTTFEAEVASTESDRHDLLFYIKDSDVPKFAVPRLSTGIKWASDWHDNGYMNDYPAEILTRYASDL